MAKQTKRTGRSRRQKTEGELVRALRGGRSFRAFEEYLNEEIPQGMPGYTTFANVWNWEQELYPVTDACLMAWRVFYPAEDARHRLALEILGGRDGSPLVGEKGMEVAG